MIIGEVNLLFCKKTNIILKTIIKINNEKRIREKVFS